MTDGNGEVGQDTTQERNIRIQFLEKDVAALKASEVEMSKAMIALQIRVEEMLGLVKGGFKYLSAVLTALTVAVICGMVKTFLTR